MRAERWIYTLPLRIRSLFRRATVERELDEELAFHLEQLTLQNIARGMTPAAARTAASRAIGGVERRKEEIRDTRRVSWLENLTRDTRSALRMLRRTPAYTAIAVLTLGVGIGANTAIFTVVNAVLLRPLPYGDPAGLVVLRYREYGTVSPAPVLRWKAEATRSFSELGAAQYHSPTITGRGDPEQVEALSVDPDVMSTLRVRPVLGRLFRPDEAHDGNAVVVLGFDFWQRRFGGDVHILGQTLTLDGVRCTVIGVMPRGFRFAPFWATASQLWMPLSLDGQENDWEGASLRVFGRLRPGVSLGQARAEMTKIGAEIGRAQPKVSPNVVVVPLQQQVVGEVRGTVWVLFAAVALVLLIACANVTHLQLMRAASRDRETAMRLSLGASRGRLVQQSLTESLILSVMGAVLGLGIAAGGVRALVALAPPGLPRIDSIHFDPRVFCYLLLAGVAAGLVSGVVPAFSAARIDPNHALKESGRGGDSRRRRRAGAALVVSECAMAVVLLIGAGLVLRSFAAMVGVDPGFNPRHVLSAQIAVRGTAHDPRPLRAAFYAEVIDRIGALPGVEAVSATNHLPLHGDTWQFHIYVAGRQYRRIEDQPRAFFRIARPGYFLTMGIPIRRGRDITTEDLVNRNQVVVIDESMARAIWPGEDPIGKRISVADPAKLAEWFTVVGVVKDVQQSNWAKRHSAEMYFPYWQGDIEEPTGSLAGLLHPSYLTVVIRTRGNPAALAPAVSRVVHGLDADVPVADLITMEQAVAEQLAEPRFYLLLLGSFAGAALMLAAVGVYGVISHSVSARTREIGIRIALGATRGAPFRLILRQGLTLALVGAVLGLLGAFALTGYLRSLLFTIQPRDLVTFVGVPLLLVMVAAAACVIPGLRAASVEPMIALRAE